MTHRYAWLQIFGTAIPLLLTACQLNDTDSAPPAPVVVDEAEPVAASAGAPAQSGTGAQEPATDAGAEPEELPEPGEEPGTGGATSMTSFDASVPSFPAFDAGSLSPGPFGMLDSAVLGVNDASLLPPNG